MTSTATPVSPPPAVESKAFRPPEDHGEQRFFFPSAGWDFYERMLRAVEGRRVFLTYFRGTLEMMTTSWEHDVYAERLGALVRILCTELRLPFVGGGSATFRLKPADAGLEPDRCFYVRNVAAVRGKRTIDLRTDPPPDLAVEVEISRRLAERVAIYESLRVPELWRCDRRRVRAFELGADGHYAERDRSTVFPTFPLGQAHAFLETGWDMDDLEWDEVVRAWIRRYAMKSRPARRKRKE